MGRSGRQGWKERVFHEMVEYGINVTYLVLAFFAFVSYRRLVLAAHDISYTNYGVALIEALIFGKVIMIGAMFHPGGGLEQKPLIHPTPYKAVVFTILVGIFTLIEQAIKLFGNLWFCENRPPSASLRRSSWTSTSMYRKRWCAISGRSCCGPCN